MVAIALVAIFLITIFIYGYRQYYTNSKSTMTMPGLDPSSKTDGNLAEIGKAGSFHEFLVDLHDEFGPIAKFWYGTRCIVSIASPKLFKEHHNMFDKPAEFFQVLLPLLGQQSIQFANGDDGRTRRRHYDRAFSHEFLSKYCLSFYKVAECIEQEWKAIGPAEQIPLGQYANHYAIKCALWSLLGDKFQHDDAVTKIKDSYDVAFSELERRQYDSDNPTKDSAALKDALHTLRTVIKEAIDQRKERSLSKQGQKLIDIFIEVCPDEETIFCDAITYTIGAFHTTANVLTWGLYFLANNANVQDKLYAEIKEILGENGSIEDSNISDFKYAIQVIDETMRCAVVAVAAIRLQESDGFLGGHAIPANTPVIHALGVVHQDETVWNQPNIFYPERFNADNMKCKAPYTFPAFGFAGKRKCPGYKFAYWEAVSFLVTIIGRFHVTCCNERPVKPVYGFVTRPNEEIWIKVTERK